jgi:hypothetical protein
MKTLLIMALATVTLVGCETQKGGTNPNAGTGEGINGITDPGERLYSSAELVIGRRICSALKYKREKMETLTNMQEKFRFRGEVKNCNATFPNIGEFTASISNANSTDLEYEAATTRPSYFKDVVTDQNGVMKTMCDNLNVSDSVSNQILNGSSYLRLNFLITDGYDTVQVVKKTRDANGAYPLVSTEGVAIITQSYQADAKFAGVEKERIRSVNCATPQNSISYTKQVWVSALTTY